MTTHPPVDVIVPFGHSPGHPERRENMLHVARMLRDDLAYGNYRVILAELGRSPTQRSTADELGIEYIFTEHDGEFSPGKAMNAGFLGREEPRELVYFHQADFLVHADVLRRSVDHLRELNSPFIYPYWGEIHLSKPVSAALRAGIVSSAELSAAFLERVPRWRRLWAHGRRAVVTSAYDEIPVHDEDLLALRPTLGIQLLRDLADAGREELWGDDDRAYAPYRWPDSDSEGSRICRISGGPRASAAYLCTDEAFRQVGGVPELKGWGYEDLIFWLTVQGFHPYAADREGVTYNGKPVTLGYPFLHLWHPVSGRHGYYAATRENEQRFRAFQRLSFEQRRFCATPLPRRRPALGDPGRPAVASQGGSP
jgi:hypothetical protein